MLISKVNSPHGSNQEAEVVFFDDREDALEAARLMRVAPMTAAASARVTAALAKARDVEDTASKATLRQLQQITSG